MPSFETSSGSSAIGIRRPSPNLRMPSSKRTTQNGLILGGHGAITWVDTRDAAIHAAVTKARAYRAAGFTDTLMPAADKDTVRHLAEEDRRRAGLAGTGRWYVTETGRRELGVGDRLMFLENSFGKRGLGVRNGDGG